MTSNPKDIPQINELLYSLILRTGENLLCTVIDMTDDGLVIECPIKVQFIPVSDGEGNINSQLISSKWNVFSTTDIFFIDFADLITYTEMDPKAHHLYVNMVNKYNSNVDSIPSTDAAFFVDSSSGVH